MTRALIAALLLLALPAQAGEAEVQALVAKKAAILANMHKKAERALVNAAQDAVFAEYFTAAEAERPAIKKRIDQLALNVQANFRVAEMCLIDDHGHEISRIVGNAVAPDADLSHDEDENPFFAVAFAKEPRQVYVAPAYLSQDAAEWTIAYVTLIGVDGRKHAILHYEHVLDEYRQALDKDVASTDNVLLAIDRDGYVLSDSRAQPPAVRNDAKTARADYFGKLETAAAQVIRLGGEGTATLLLGGNSYLAAYKAVEDWTIVALERTK